MKKTKLIIDNSALLVYCGLDGEKSRKNYSKYFDEADMIFAPSLVQYEFIKQI